MKDGIIKVAVGTPEVRVADCVYNGEQAAQLAQEADALGAQLLVLPELQLTGYTCGDLFLQPTLLNGALDALAKLLERTKDTDMVVVAGLPVNHRGKLYNCAAVCQKGEVLGLVPKTNLPNYGEFYERRQFTPAFDGIAEISLWGRTVPFGKKLLFSCEELPEFVLGVEICEDLWAMSPPSISLAAAGATVIANLSASNETVGKDEYRRRLVTGQSARLVCGYLYADAGEGESTTDMVFAGHDLIAENGVLLGESGKFTTGLTVSEIDTHRLSFERRRLTSFPHVEGEGFLVIPFSQRMRETTLTRPVSSSPFIPSDPRALARNCEDILTIQAAGLAKRLTHSHAKTAVVGVSGGLDSALALLATVRAMERAGRPRTDIVAVIMPCFGTTQRTKSNAEILCERLGVQVRVVDIARAVEVHFSDIGKDPENQDVTYENAQARERTQVLMDISNLTGGLVVGTGDLSELALGWATYNGDHMSMYGVNASIPKTLVRHLVAHEAGKTGDAQLKKVLLDILDTPVSPELLPAKEGEIQQKTEDIVGPYELHDFFLYHGIRWGCPPKKVLRLAQYAFGEEYDRATILHWLKNFYRRFFAQQFKRSCLPDGPKVGSVSLSPRGDWRMPSDASAALWLSQLQSLEEEG
ncbi:NAD(+) synthase [Zongyangia hominis]|uniref:Glutamine-dependent NAD(+) synthetase n=1 Tax=Zongyangia hominis TaxID=2763677 RepID=A0A926ED02_9FIRM|nr:NAD(+) synthase [Zongyangia hominis]MBC8570803.1 NAD(+) synthase [Zongyangia hominis]